MNREEDAVWGGYWRPPRFVPPGTQTDRMYPVAPDSIYPVPEWRVDVLVAEAELVFISQTGAIEVQQKVRDDLLGEVIAFPNRREQIAFERADADGDTVWSQKNRLKS